MKIKIFLVLFMFSTSPAMAAFTGFITSRNNQAQQDEWRLQEEKRMQIQRQQQWQEMENSQQQFIQQQQHDELIRTLNKFNQ
jgi:hypothetical protein